jgi:MYXO-CTERM domain-containing protein
LGIQSPLAAPDNNFLLDSPVPIGQLNVLVSQASAAGVSSKELETGPVFSPPADSQSSSNPPASYWQLNGTNIAANSSVAVAIRLPGETGPDPMTRNLVVLGGGALAGLLLLLYPFWRRRREPAYAVDERIARLQAIADLDDAYAAGTVDEISYQDQRAALRAQLADDTDTPS